VGRVGGGCERHGSASPRRAGRGDNYGNRAGISAARGQGAHRADDSQRIVQVLRDFGLEASQSVSSSSRMSSSRCRQQASRGGWSAGVHGRPPDQDQDEIGLLTQSCVDGRRRENL
jgi:hypothetical protein